MIKDKMNIQVEKICTARCEGRGRASMPSLGATLPVLHVFIQLEALQTLYFWGFKEASSHRHDPSLTPFPLPLSSLENGDSAKIPSF